MSKSIFHRRKKQKEYKINKNLHFQTQTAAGGDLRTEPNHEELMLALQMKALSESSEYKALMGIMAETLQELYDTAFNSSRPQPARINALEQITGIRMVLEYPSNCVAAVEEILKPMGRTLGDYGNISQSAKTKGDDNTGDIQ